jgi:outer membrane protein assembly factor BamA
LGRKKTTGLYLFLAMIILAGCNVTKNFPPNSYLLVKNKIHAPSAKVSKDDLSGYLQQEPNVKALGLFRPNIAFYYAGSKGKETKFKKWMRTKIGTAPVFLDSTLITIAKKQMGLYLANKGYFNAVIKDSVIIHKKKAIVVYKIIPNTPYTIRSIRWSIADTALAKFVYLDSARTLVHAGQNYDMYLLDSERSRITTALMNHGYYHFSTMYVHYRIDSAFNKNVMDVTKEIRNPVIPSLDFFGTFVESKHARYTIGKILIHPEYSLLQSDTLSYDTLVVTFKTSRHDTTGNTYYFLYKNKMKLKPRTLAQMIFLKTGTYYNLGDVSQTYSQLASLQVFNYMNIQLHEASGSGPKYRDKLDCRILLSRAPVHSFSISTDVTNSAGAFGLQGAVGYMNRNIFRGGQLLKISLNGAAQMQGSTSDVSSNFINTIEFGINTSLTFPQFLIPIKPEWLPKRFKPRTTISLGYNFQKRPDYDRHISNVSFGYSWNQTEKIKHMFNPAEITMVKIWPDSAFTAYLDGLTDKRLKNQYTDHLVAGLKYTFTFNGQDLQNIKDFFYIRSNFETGGNLLYAIDKIANAPKTDGYYTLFKIQYSQFVRPDFDVRFYHFFAKNTSLVSRVYAGFGIPYGNSISLPFEKAFFAGGANDLRGWKMGSLGPGSYFNDSIGSTYDQTGEMQLQMNLEYRFPIYKYFRSAFFVDLGNIWMLKANPDLPGGTFQLNHFIDEIAVDFGVGLRADFDYFIIRFDPAVPIRVPYYPENNHWYIQKLNLTDIIWNFGIGYPF